MRRPSSGSGREAIPQMGETAHDRAPGRRGPPAKKSSARHLEPALQLRRLLVTDGDDAITGPDLAGRGRFLVPLLLHADLVGRDHFREARQRQAQLVDRLVARCLAADQQHAARRQVAELAHAPAADRIDHFGGDVDRLAMGASAFLRDGRHERAPGIGGAWRRLSASARQARSKSLSLTAGTSETLPAEIAWARSDRLISSARCPWRVTNRPRAARGEYQA